MKFLMQEPQFSPLRHREASTSELSGVSVVADSVSNQAVCTAIASEPASTKSSDSTYGLLGVLPHPSESDPTGLSASQQGAKLDKGKVDVLRGAIQYFPKALEAVAHVSELGARKYSWMGWKSVPDGIRRYGAALARHLVYAHDDRDTGPGGLGPDVLHAAQVAWNALARLELIIKEQDEKNSNQS